MMKWSKRKDEKQPTSSVEEQRLEKLAEMGGQLWASRQEQGLSLDEMVAMTRIPRRLLQAIEEGNVEELPEPIYIQGLIRQFADALGFNGADFASTFPISSNRVSIKPTWKNPPMGQLRPIHLYALYILLIVCSVNGLSQLLNNSALQASNTQIKPKSPRESFVKQDQKQPPLEAVNDTTNASKLNNQQVQIGVTLKEKSWIRVVADGKTVFEDELPEGTQRTWKAQDQLTVRAGNAGGVLVSVNKEQAKPMGVPGQVEELKIAAKPRT